MKRKELILLENRLRKLLKEDTITDPYTGENVEVAPGIILPQVNKLGNYFDKHLGEGQGLEPRSQLDFNSKLRHPGLTAGTEYEEFARSPYDGGVVRYQNPNKVVMYFNGKPDSKHNWNPESRILDGKSVEWLNTFVDQEQWNEYVKKPQDISKFLENNGWKKGRDTKNNKLILFYGNWVFFTDGRQYPLVDNPYVNPPKQEFDFLEFDSDIENIVLVNKQRKRKYFSDIFPNIKNSSQSNSPSSQSNSPSSQSNSPSSQSNSPSSQSNSPSPKMYNPSTKKIQNYILKYFPNHKDLLGTKRPNDGLWGVKTDEAILRIIHDIEQKTKPQTKMTAANVEKTQSKTSKIG